MIKNILNEYFPSLLEKSSLAMGKENAEHFTRKKY